MLMVSREVGEVSVADESDWSNRATPRIALRSHVVFRRPVLQCVLHCVLHCVLQCVAVFCSVLRVAVCVGVLQRAAVFCSMLQFVAVCCSTLQLATPRIALRSHVIFRHPALQCVLHCALQYVAECCSV